MSSWDLPCSDPLALSSMGVFVALELTAFPGCTTALICALRGPRIDDVRAGTRRV